MTDQGTWVNVNEAARRLGVTPRAVRNRLKRGTLQSRPKGNAGREVLLPEGTGDGSGDPFRRLAEVEVELALTRRELELLRERLDDERERRRERVAELEADRDRLVGLLAAALARPPSILERLVRAFRRP